MIAWIAIGLATALFSFALAAAIVVLALLYLLFRFLWETPPYCAAIGRWKASRSGARLVELRRSAAVGDADAFVDRVVADLSARGVQPDSLMGHRLASVVRHLHEREFLASPVPLPKRMSALDAAIQRDRDEALAAKLVDPATPIVLERTLAQLGSALAQAFPRTLSTADPINQAGQHGLTVPLIDFVADPGKLIATLTESFERADVSELGLFEDLRQRLEENLYAMSELAYEPAETDPRRLVKASKHKGHREEIVRGYLRNTPFADLLLEPVPFSIPQHLRFEGTWIVAPAGTGKTTLLSSLLKADLEEVRVGRASIIVMDSKGELTRNLARSERFAPGGDLYGKLVLIEPSSHLAINPIDLGASIAHTIGLIEYLFSFGLETTAKQSGLFRAVLIALSAIPDASFATFRSFLRAGWEPYREHIEKLHREDRDFFTKPTETGASEYDDRGYMETKRQLLWRIQDLTTRVPLLRDMFSAPKTLIDLGKEMDAGRVIVIDNASQTLDQAGSEFFGRLFLALIRGQAEQREGRKFKLPCYVYIDECDTVIAHDENVNTILTKCRSQKIALTLAHQKLADITSDRVKAALRDCGVRFANVDDEAPDLAARMRTTPDKLRQLSTGQFALFMRRMTQSLTVKIANNPISDWSKMSPEQFEAIRQMMASRFHYRPSPSAPPDEPPPGEPPAADTTPAKWG